MSILDPRTTLHTYLQRGRDALVWKLHGLGEYDIRRPMTTTGTNLLGLVKHVAGTEVVYFGTAFGRPFPIPLPWYADADVTNADMWATADQSREQILDLYRAAWQHSDETIETLDLDAVGVVPHWAPDRARTTLHHLLVHMIAETERHTGQADILRESLDGAVGVRADGGDLPGDGPAWWQGYRKRVEEAAVTAARNAGEPTGATMDATIAGGDRR